MNFSPFAYIVLQLLLQIYYAYVKTIKILNKL